MSENEHQPGLCLIAEARADADLRARLAAALEATGAATLILVAPPGGRLEAAALRPLVGEAQGLGVAALVADDIEAARAAGADGVHLSWRPEIEDAYAAARAALGARAIVGADAGLSRHDAMTLGEAGADYVAFGRSAEAGGAEAAREAQRELVAWWAELFVVPVVAVDLETADDVAEARRLGADFAAARLPAEGRGSDADAAWAADLVAALGAPAGTA